MKWYSVKKYRIPANQNFIMVALEVDDIVVYKMADYRYNPKTDSFCWFNEEGNTLSQVSHFCVPDPVECEE